MNLPDDLKGSRFVLFSHPADFTPVCTTEFVSFLLPPFSLFHFTENIRAKNRELFIIWQHL